MNYSQESAFTFLEILISITIAIILASISVVSFVNFSSQQNLKSESQSIIALLHSAQERSMNQENSSRWGVSFYNSTSNRDNYALFMVDEDEFASSTANVPGTVSEMQTLPARLSFFTNPGLEERLNIAFSRISGLPSASTEIYLAITSDPNSSSTISIESNGLIHYE